MAATIVIAQRSGLGYSATEVAKADFYFLTIDSNIETPTNYPITVPSVSTAYSYEVWLRFRCDVAPSTYCKNFKIWATWSNPTGQDITINTSIIDTYVSPVNTLSVIGTRDSMKDHTSGDKINIGNSLVNIGDKTSWMVFQLGIGTTANPGNFNDYTIFYQYDEI